MEYQLKRQLPPYMIDLSHKLFVKSGCNEERNRVTVGKGGGVKLLFFYNTSRVYAERVFTPHFLFYRE
jgi:hypothetical protein